MAILRTVVGKMWLTIMGLVGVVIITIGFFLLEYIDLTFADPVKVKHLFIYSGIVGFLLTTFFAFFLLTKITNPLREMKDAANRVAQGDYTTRVAIRSSDEIGELANTFNQMASELHTLIRDIQHERDHLSSVLRSMTDSVISFDSEGEVILTNPQGQHLLEEWQTVDWTDADEDEEARERDIRVPGPLRETFRNVIAGGKELTVKIHVKSGVWSVVMTPLVSTDSVRGAVAVLRDVTEEFRVDKMRKDFVANVSHEIRTPLSMVQGYSEALMDDIASTPEERRELVQVIHDESLRMGRLVKDLLDLARMEAGYLEMNFQPVDVNALVSRVYRKFAALAKERQIKLTRSPDDPALTLEAGDADRLEQVLTNLMDNALRHTPAGASIALEAGRVSALKGEWLELKVNDQGHGIPYEDLPYVFERFYKADKARKRETTGGGTGLGLAIAKNLIVAHGGTISVSSEPGAGTTFTILLPVATGRKADGEAARH
ncbi:sensor histidine kinase [Cohnella sp. CIP 111063]|uniref:HAMP domain-containing sensor histidine kinase n=1 Tax=unclassified Cohnella TaxID=2636738 RepID=UPI000B8C00B1|nr:MULTISPECIES: ATP-binding protein [unclassified Cohnella]OXS61245.1 sensor histidine kinase [Cohnella sp. CIP 111063]PRX73818.1 PAS/PAC sensor signal transduction histidine kinase [Cohnella sp. SGD-V74]